MAWLTGTVIERDYRITGEIRAQSDVVKAPVGFERELIASSENQC